MILTAKPEIGTTKKEEDISSTVFFIFVTSNLRLGEPILNSFFMKAGASHRVPFQFDPVVEVGFL